MSEKKKTIIKFEFELGEKLRCKVTGFEGTATGRIQYLNGCVQFLVRPRVNEKGEFPDGQWIDYQQLELVEDEPKVEINQKSVGGENSNAPSSYAG